MDNPYENIAFAGGNGTHTVLSVLAGEHSIGGGILSFFRDDMKQGNIFRLVCQEFKEAATEFPWMDKETRITGDLMEWRAIFPFARAVNVSLREDLVDADFVHIRGDARLHFVDMNTHFFWGSKVTDAAFVYLRGIHTLVMQGCYLVTDAAFINLRGIHTLNMWHCTQVTDAAFVHLRGIQELNMCSCTKVTDAAFIHLRGIHTLDMSLCNQITDAAFVNLRGIHTLSMIGCTNTTAALAHLHGITDICANGCSPDVQAAAAALRVRTP